MYLCSPFKIINMKILNHKQNVIVMLLVLASILTLTSCKKTKNELFKGYYSFKTSGVLTVEKKICNNSGTVISVDESEMSLTTENGQMNILSVDNKTGEMIVTMNIVGGDVLRYDAIADDKTLTIENQKRTIKFEDLEFVPLTVTVSGIGNKYDESVVFDLKYDGSLTVTGIETVTTYTITDSDINCVARSND